jgi:hypothetical protein
MKKLNAAAKSYESGANAYFEKKTDAGNPHAADTSLSKSCEHGYLDRQKLDANRDVVASRKRATLHIIQIH